MTPQGPKPVGGESLMLPQTFKLPALSLIISKSDSSLFWNALPMGTAAETPKAAVNHDFHPLMGPVKDVVSPRGHLKVADKD